MKTFGLQKNMVFKWTGQTFKIDRLDTLNHQVLIERVTDGAISIHGENELLSEYMQGRIIFEDSSSTANNNPYQRPLSDLPEEIKLAAERRRHYLSIIYENGDPIFTTEYLAPLILKAAKLINDKSAPSVSTVYRWHRKYLQSEDTRSLIPRTDLRGSRFKKQPEKLNKLFMSVVEKAYTTSVLVTGQEIYNRLQYEINLLNQRLLPFEQLMIPSKRTVYRMINAISPYEMAQMKYGKASAEKKFRLSLGKTQTENILERVEVDHTPLDLFLVDEKSKLPIGRPTLTVILDHFSRMLLGYYISFQNPSTASVMGALRHAILPKNNSKPIFPDLNVEHEWPCYGIPDVMVLDNGLEFHSNDLESVAFDLGIRIQYCPKHEPRFKGSVERYLKTVNYTFASQLPGASAARFHLRGEYDPLINAIFTLGEFNHLFEKWVLDVYSQTIQRGIKTTPWQKWQDGLKMRAPKLPKSPSELNTRIGKVEARKLRRDGINLKGIIYNDESLSTLVRLHGEGIKVRVLYDPQDLAEIQIWGPDAEFPLTVLALDQAYARGLTELQHQLIQKSIRENGLKALNKEALTKAKSEMSRQVDELLESRKLRKRRRGSAISGINSNNPVRSKSIEKSETENNYRQPINSSAVKNSLPEVLPRFHLQIKNNQSGRKSK